MKRVVPFVLTFAMLFSTAVFADESTTTTGDEKTPVTTTAPETQKEDAEVTTTSAEITAVTRLEFATELYEKLGSPEVADKDVAKFTDTTAETLYAVSYLAKMGYMVGYNDTTFGAADPINRQMAIAICARVLKAEPKDADAYKVFKDADEIDSWATAAVSAMLEQKVFVGNEDGTLAPKAPLTSEQIVIIMDKLVTLLPKDEATTTDEDTDTKEDTVAPDATVKLSFILISSAEGLIKADVKDGTVIGYADITTLAPVEAYKNLMPVDADGNAHIYQNGMYGIAVKDGNDKVTYTTIEVTSFGME